MTFNSDPIQTDTNCLNLFLSPLQYGKPLKGYDTILWLITSPKGHWHLSLRDYFILKLYNIIILLCHLPTYITKQSRSFHGWVLFRSCCLLNNQYTIFLQRSVVYLLGNCVSFTFSQRVMHQDGHCSLQMNNSSSSSR